jgi:isopropylmalate/homocitrate/citramalate synthase
MLKRRQGGGKGPRYGKNVDANQLEIVQALEAIGCDVLEVGWPVDLLVGYRALNFLIEVKDPNKPPSERKLTAEQDSFFKLWRGQVRKVETADDAIHLVTRAHRHDKTKE